MAVIEILLGERTHQGLVGGITFDPNEGLICGVVNGFNDREPVAQLRERFAKLKARDALLGAVLARLGADPGARETEAHNAVGRLLADREAVSKVADCYVGAAKKIAQGLGLSATKPDELAAQVLAMNAELTSALDKTKAKLAEADRGAIEDVAALRQRAQLAEGEVKALAEENARLRAEVKQERGYKLHAMTAADIAISRSADLEAEVQILKGKIGEADFARIMAEATAAGMRTALQHLERVMREKLRT